MIQPQEHSLVPALTVMGLLAAVAAGFMLTRATDEEDKE
jgi:hypothetical protein